MLLISDEVSERTKELAPKSKPDDFLTKPFNTMALEMSLWKILKQE